MPIGNQEFIQLINSIQNYGPDYYVGMGNPDSEILLVGSEKALNITQQPDIAIAEHELYQNHNHWRDILNNYHHPLINPFEPMLMERMAPLSGFNPFNPLLFTPTADRVMGKAGHTYYGMQRLINAYQIQNGNPPLNIFNIAFEQNTFSKVFLTELSATPASNQGVANFNLDQFLQSPRYNFLTHDTTYNFFSTFRTVVLYFGRNNTYAGNLGTEQRLQIARIFNRNLSHLHGQVIAANNVEVYISDTCPRVVFCRHLSQGFSREAANAIVEYF